MIASESDILQCQFNNWYPLFVGKTFKSRVIPLPDEFVQYLAQDGIILPKSSKNYFSADALSDDEDEGLREVCDDAKDLDNSSPDFPELDALINSALAELSGQVVVKTNWSCPLDAGWVNGGSMKCRSVSDIYLILKASDRISFDLDHMFDLCGHKGIEPNVQTTAAAESTVHTISSSTVDDTDTVVETENKENTKSNKTTSSATLVLRKWANLNPAMEFRVFVYNQTIIGICQRDCCTYYNFLEDKIDAVQDLILKFFSGSEGEPIETTATNSKNNSLNNVDRFGVKGVFPLENFVMDVYVDGKNRVWIVDFNPFGEPTCALLFEWAELLDIASTYHGNNEKILSKPAAMLDNNQHNGSEQLCEFRIIESEQETLQSTNGSNRGPIDVHAATEFKSFMDICKSQQTQQNTDSDED